MAGELGKASLEVEADLGTFERNVHSADRTAHEFEHTLDALTGIAKITEVALKQVKMSPGQAAESKASAEGILSGVRGISEESRTAAREIDNVRITEAQAAASDAAGGQIERKLKGITRNANEARRATESVRISGGVPGRSGVGVGPFGSGFGRIGLLGAGIGAGTLLGPAAGPGAIGLLASIPTLAGAGAGALGTLALAFQGVGKAIGGDAKAFKDLGPAAQSFVQTVRSLDGWFDKLKETAAGSLFPGLTAALHSALSPGTLSAITTAVTEFGKAIGQAGAQWGKYFGSAQFQQIFGPLMAAGARTVTVLSDTLLHLFDALGVVGKAAIPFTSWLTRMIDAGSRFADSWLRAKSATGELGHALNEAKTSLTLVAKLAGSLLNVVFSLGKALYPVSKIAVKALTDGLNALARIIQHNQQGIRDFVQGALDALVSAVKVAAPIVAKLAHGLSSVVHAMGGWKTAFELVIGGFLAFKFVKLAGAIAKVGPAIGKIGLAAETEAGAVGGLRAALLGLGAPEVLLTLAAVADALLLIHALRSPNPKVVGKTASGTNVVEAGGNLYVQSPSGGRLTRLSPGSKYTLTAPNVAGDSNVTGGVGQHGALRTNHAPKAQPGVDTPYLSLLLARAEATKTFADDRSVLERMIAALKSRQAKATTLAAQTALQDAINADQQALKAGSPFGTPPPFTKNTGAGAGKPAVIPPLASHDIQLASANASKASALGNVGAAAKKYLEAELGNLSAADKLIKAKYEHATGKARTQLFAALTSVENKMRAVRARVAKAIKDDRAAELQFAVDQAKDAVASAEVGSAAYDKAIAAEEKALRAQIAYLDKRAKNSHLSLKEREKDIRLETADKKQLASLLKQSAVNAGSNESQFISSFADIVKAFAPNAFPTPTKGKTDTHLYDLVQESRETNDHLRDIRAGQRFPASRYASLSAAAVTG